MYYIEEKGSSFKIENFLWDNNGYEPETIITIGYDDGGYHVHCVSYETEIRRVQTEHNTEVFKDSCMEIFMQFDPKKDERYINIEVNPNGAAYSAISACREISEKIQPEIISTLNIKTQIYEDRWEIEYYIPVEYIKRVIPSYTHKKGNVIRGNFYKCGNNAKYPHHGCLNKIDWEKPDFHRPEFFVEFELR